MRMLKASITPLSAFGTRPLGDTLFGQLCWAVRNRWSEDRLRDLLAGYTEGRPFAVVSDAMPAGYVPRATLPGSWFVSIPNEDRKVLKRKVWLPHSALIEPVEAWPRHCYAATDLSVGRADALPHPHNVIDRRTGTTGADFAPFTMTRIYYGRRGDVFAQGGAYSLQTACLDIWLILDEKRLSIDDMTRALQDVGALGFGRDAGIGLGRFEVAGIEECTLQGQHGANAWMTLAPSAPQGLDWDSARSFYTVFTRFGRHGDMGVRYGRPFKSPVLLANSGAVLCPQVFDAKLFVGRGLGGDGGLSKTIPQTVQQGYAPAVAIRLPENSGHV